MDDTSEALAALQKARALIEKSFGSPERRRQVGDVIAEIDRATARLDPSAAASAPMTPPASVPPSSGEVEALRREVERLTAMGAWDRPLLDTILHQSPHGIIVCDDTGKLILQNRASERIWAGSATAENVEGWGRYRAFHPDGRPYEPQDWSMARCLSERRVIEAEEVHFQRFDGTHGTLLGSCAPLAKPGGALLGAVSIFADITEWKRAEQLKERWVALAAHELRTPLSVLKTRVEASKIRLSRGLPIDMERLLPVIERQVERLTTMVNDMLDVSRAQAGTLEVKTSPMRLITTIPKVVDALVAGSPAHEAALDVEDVTVSGDPLRVEQVVSNLVGNAIRYSPRGGRIDVTARRWGGEAIIEVNDQGEGFDPSLAPTLFEPFIQAKRGTNRESGLGLGLYLARELVTRMGGRIWAQSEGPGQGARFSFTLPLSTRDTI